MILKWIQLIVLLLLGFSTSYCQGTVIPTKSIRGTNSKIAKSYYDQGIDKFDQKDFAKAVELYKLAIIADTNFIDAYDNLGVSFRHLNMLDSAEHYYLASFEKDSTNTTAIQNLAVVAELQNNLQKAKLLYLLFTGMEPENPEGHFGLARMQYLAGELTDALKSGQLAEQYYKKASSQYIGDCYYILCIICYDLKKTDEAKKYLKLCKDSGMSVDPKLEEALK